MILMINKIIEAVATKSQSLRKNMPFCSTRTNKYRVEKSDSVTILDDII
jgi:hypothetical protein